MGDFEVKVGSAWGELRSRKIVDLVSGEGRKSACIADRFGGV